MHDYFYGVQSEQFSFIRIPTLLFTDDQYKYVSADAKILYGILLARMDLSAKNGWIDDQGRVYIICTLSEIMEKMNCADNKATKLMNELEDRCGLIERKRQGLGKPNLIYVKNFLPVDNPVESRFKTRENHDSGVAEITIQDSSKSRPNNKEDKYIDLRYTENPIYPGWDADGMSDYERYKEYFQTGEGLWSGMTLYELYQKAYTPWEWQPKLKKLADEIGILLFSSPFDLTSVDFLEKMEVPAYKIASFEISDIPLIRKVARTGKPVIISTGIAELGDISQAIEACKREGNDQIILLKCTSEYPAPYEEINLSMLPNMKETFGCVTGISDHSLGDEISIASVALGANVVEKHFTLSRADGGVDSAFSMETEEMRLMIEKIRHVEAAMGKVSYELDQKQKKAKAGGRSLFASTKIKAGEVFTADNVKSVRPGMGLSPKYYDRILGKRASHDIDFAEPLHIEDICW